MKIYKYAPGIKLDGESVVALGLFDGVHAGHRRLLMTARDEAKRRGLCFTVFTFDTLTSKKGTRPIYTTEEKMRLFEELSVDAVALTDFSSVASLSAEDFVKSCLYADMGCRVAVAGYDFRYAKGREGDAESLKATLDRLGAECIIEQEHKIDGVKISSTKIKELLSVGDVENARRFLGEPYRIRSRVERGLGLGKKLGFPTVNTDINGMLADIRSGVYRTAVKVGENIYIGVTNVGTCPTFGERAKHAETYLIGCDTELYGQDITVYFLGFLREEKRFSSPEELIMQINVDKNRAIKENGDLKWLEIGLS